MLPDLPRSRERPEAPTDGGIIYMLHGFMKTGAQSGSAIVEIAGSGGVNYVS